MLNLVHLIGRLGQDVRITSFQDGSHIARVSVAVERKWKDRDSGEQKKRTDWFDAELRFGDNDRQRKFLEETMRKGALVAVKGQLRQTHWKDEAGNDRKGVKIECDRMGGLLFLRHAQGGGEQDRRDDGPPPDEMQRPRKDWEEIPF